MRLDYTSWCFVLPDNSSVGNVCFEHIIKNNFILENTVDKKYEYENNHCKFWNYKPVFMRHFLPFFSFCLGWCRILPLFKIIPCFSKWSYSSPRRSNQRLLYCIWRMLHKMPSLKHSIPFYSTFGSVLYFGNKISEMFYPSNGS